MNLSEAQNEFALRLYKWSLRDLLRELEAGCPLLSLVSQNNLGIGGFVSWNKTLSTEQRLQLAEVTTRLAHDCVRSTNEQTIKDKAYWENTVYEATTIHMRRLPPNLSANRDLPTFRPINPDNCLDELVGSLDPSTIGKPVRRRSGVRCMRRMGDWKLITEFTFERWRKDLSFTYQFIRKDDTSSRPTPEIGPRPFPRSLFAFYGIYNRTVVAAESEADGLLMAKAMAKLGEHFVAQADPIFAGLGVSD